MRQRSTLPFRSWRRAIESVLPRDADSIDESYLSTLGIKVSQGRNFSGLGDTLHSILINEAMIEDFGWGDQALGKRVTFPGDTSGAYLEVVGVFKNFDKSNLEMIVNLLKSTNN